MGLTKYADIDFLLFLKLILFTYLYKIPLFGNIFTKYLFVHTKNSLQITLNFLESNFL